MTDQSAAERLLPAVYAELRSVAASLMHRERDGHTLQPTALVHEAFLRLSRDGRFECDDPRHFIGIAARAMRQILVNHALARKTLKRGGDRARVPLDAVLDHYERRANDDVVALDAALERLAELDPEQARVVELRFFGGLTIDEAAALLGVSTRTVDRDWAAAKAWLRRQLDPDVNDNDEVEPRHRRNGTGNGRDGSGG